jgi:chromosome partitioning protein
VLHNSIAVMNAKGGVGKSTLVLALAETLSAKFGKNVLVIDTDAQASVSLMLMSAGNLNGLQLDGLTIVDVLVDSVLKSAAVRWSDFVLAGVSDVEEARTVYLLPSDMQLTLFEREVAQKDRLPSLRASIRELLRSMRDTFDVILIDCPPALSVVTECWLREADFHITPTNPDHISAYALEVLNHFKGLHPEMGLAQHLGVLITMKELGSSTDADYERKLRGTLSNRCFTQAVPRTTALQHASHFASAERRYDKKYPSESGDALQRVCRELLDRLSAANRSKPDAAPRTT